MAEISKEVCADENKVSKALLVGVCRRSEDLENTRSLVSELAELVKNIGVSVAETMLARVSEVNPQYLVGSGKFAEIVERAKEIGADCVVFDDALSPAQQRNWERDGAICVIDRQEVILDIFADRAQTREARLQVELARLEYSLPRLKRAWTHLSRQRGGGVTQRGEGESQLELDQRLIRVRIAKLKKELEVVKSSRHTQRKRRTRLQIPSAAIVGYTNAGKSSLLNALSGSSVLAQDKLFATLDPTTRKVSLPSGSTMLLTDTVGFVRNLPHHFVDAFKATLEEALISDFLIHVVDASSAEAIAHIDTTNAVLKELGADSKRALTVFNKCDLAIDEIEHARLRGAFPDGIFVSAKTGEGMDKLLLKLSDMSQAASEEMTLLIPHDKYKLISTLYAKAKVRSKKDEPCGVLLHASVPRALVSEYENFLADSLGE